jgi:predicted phosphoadenosine phosphosulfate sulfurtransferase
MRPDLKLDVSRVLKKLAVISFRDRQARVRILAGYRSLQQGTWSELCNHSSAVAWTMEYTRAFDIGYKVLTSAKKCGILLEWFSCRIC